LFLEETEQSTYALAKQMGMATELYQLSRPRSEELSNDFLLPAKMDTVHLYTGCERLYLYIGEKAKYRLSSVEDIKYIEDGQIETWNGEYLSHPVIRDLWGKNPDSLGVTPKLYDPSESNRYRSPFHRNTFYIFLLLPDYTKALKLSPTKSKIGICQIDDPKKDVQRLKSELKENEELLYPQPYTRPYTVARNSDISPPVIAQAFRDARFIPSISVLDAVNEKYKFPLVEHSPLPGFGNKFFGLSIEDRLKKFSEQTGEFKI
jgi:hypothetical protein